MLINTVPFRSFSFFQRRKLIIIGPCFLRSQVHKPCWSISSKGGLLMVDLCGTFTMAQWEHQRYSTIIIWVDVTSCRCHIFKINMHIYLYIFNIYIYSIYIYLFIKINMHIYIYSIYIYIFNIYIYLFIYVFKRI